MQIEIPEAGMNRIIVKLVGDTPLISSRMSPEVMKEIDEEAGPEGTRLAKLPKPKNTAEKSYQDSIYATKSGLFGFPTMAFKKATMTAATNMKKAKTKNIDGKKAAMSFFIEGDEITEIITPGPKMRFQIARNKKAGNVPVATYHAQYDEWAVKLLIRYNTSMTSPEQILMMLQEAGHGVGVGSMRPETQGASFGLFHVEEVVECK